MTSRQPVPEPDDAAMSILSVLDPPVPTGGTVLRLGPGLARRWATEDRDRHPWLTFETRKGR